MPTRSRSLVKPSIPFLKEQLQSRLLPPLGWGVLRSMPVRKVKGGFKFGKKGKVFKSKKKAAKQGAAIKASQKRRRGGKKK